MLPYLNQIKATLAKLLLSNKSMIADDGISKHTSEAINVSFEDAADIKLQIKCQKAAEELRYIKKFSHWPVSMVKESTALVCCKNPPPLKETSVPKTKPADMTKK